MTVSYGAMIELLDTGGVRFVVPGRPALLNAERSSHWSVRAAATAQIRADVGWLALSHRDLFPSPATVVSWPTYTDRVWPDVGAWFPTVKAAIDGMVDAGAWPDDSPAHVARLVFEAPRLGDRDELTIEIRPTEGVQQ